MLSVGKLTRHAKDHRILAGIGANLISELGRAALLPAIAIVAARYLGADRYGIFATGQALTAFAATFAGFGLLHAVLLIGARREEPLSSLLTSSLAGALVTAAAAYGALMVWLWVFGYSPTTKTAVLIMGAALFPMAANAQLTAALQVHGRYTLIAIGGFAAAAVNVAYAVAVVVAGQGLNAICVAPVVASCSLTVLLIAALRDELRLNIRARDIERLFRTGFLFGLGDFLYFIYFSIDLVLLSVLSDARQVGLYNIPVRILVVAYLLPMVVFNRVLYPRYFEWGRNDRDRLRRTYVLTSKGMLFIGMVAAALLIVAADPLVPAIFTGSFKDSAMLLRILALALPLRYMSGSASAVLATTDKIATRVRIQAATAVLNVALCLAMIPALEAGGAAISTVITEAFLAVAQIAVVRAQVVGTGFLRETRVWLFLPAAAALLAAAAGHQPEWLIAVEGLGALASLALIAGPLRYFGAISLPLPTRTPAEGEPAGLV